MKYLTLFDTQTEYEGYVNGGGLVLPNVSFCEDEREVHYKPYEEPHVETRVITKYNVTDTSSFTKLLDSADIFKSMEIDGVMLDELVTEYKFDTIGEHTIKYELYDNTKLGNGGDVFSTSNLVECIIPDSVTSIDDWVFENCSGLTSIIIPNGVISIGDGVFDSCSSLTSITIGNGVTSIGDGVFTSCSSLTSIVFNAMTAPTISNETFYDIKMGGTLTVPAGSTGYDTWMGTGAYYLGYSHWTKVEQ